ncbi:MAG TPA: Ig-like domain-containing protein [Gemmatimonadales bacterium]|nr:Ig-like domain-containing protein [Gemmatimonadales bacterium]
MLKMGLARYALAAAIAIACGDSTGAGVTTLVVTPDSIGLLRGQSAQLTVTAFDADTHLVVGIAIIFESADTSKATVSNTGMVLARQKGNTSITVRGGGAVTHVPVTITVPVGGVMVAPSDTTLPLQATMQLRAHVVDIDGDTVTGPPLTYFSSNVAVASVTATGVVRADGIGQAFVYAQSGGWAGAAHVTVPDTTTPVPDSSVIATVPVSGSNLAVAVHGNLAYVTRVSTPYVQVLSLTSLTVVDSIQVGFTPCGIVLNSAGTRGYVANQGSNSVSIIDLATRTQIGTISLNGSPLPVALSPDDSVLFVATNVNRLYKIALATNTVVDSLPLPETSHYLLAHPNDTLLYVATRAAGTVLEVNWRTMGVTRTFGFGGMTQGMVLAPDRSELYVINETLNKLHIITLSTSAATSLLLAAAPHSIGLSGDGSKLYAGLLYAGKITVFDRVTRARLYNVVTGGVVRWMAADAPRSRMIVANEAGWVDVLR